MITDITSLATTIGLGILGWIVVLAVIGFNYYVWTRISKLEKDRDLKSRHFSFVYSTAFVALLILLMGIVVTKLIS